MKIFISVDLEGVSGVVSKEQILVGKSGYAHACKLLVGEVNAAIDGAFSGGAKEVYVNDCHGYGRNLLIDELHPDAILGTGAPKPLIMMQGIDSSFSLAAFIGYHCRKDTKNAIIDHTFSNAVREVTLQGQPVGEFGIAVGTAGYFDVPAGFISGDNMMIQEARELIPNIETVQVKTADARTVASCLHPVKARELIKKKMKYAIENAHIFKPYKVKPPITFELDFAYTNMAVMAALMPSVEQISPTRVTLTHPDYITAFKGLKAMLNLGECVLTR